MFRIIPLYITNPIQSNPKSYLLANCSVFFNYLTAQFWQAVFVSTQLLLEYSTGRTTQLFFSRWKHLFYIISVFSRDQTNLHVAMSVGRSFFRCIVDPFAFWTDRTRSDGAVYTALLPRSFVKCVISAPLTHHSFYSLFNRIAPRKDFSKENFRCKMDLIEMFGLVVEFV